jgi:hypothetical protein
MKKNLTLLLFLASTILSKAQTMEINVFGLYDKPQTKIKTSADMITQGSIDSKRVGKGIEVKLALIKNAYIGMTYQQSLD